MIVQSDYQNTQLIEKENNDKKLHIYKEKEKFSFSFKGNITHKILQLKKIISFN